ncbi:hypothetical protein I3760_06G135500 [Carya illinoinensis]|nr:hypothetical protein I3760_06G135500 [Carya illinoinensis]
MFGETPYKDQIIFYLFPTACPCHFLFLFFLSRSLGLLQPVAVLQPATPNLSSGCRCPCARQDICIQFVIYEATSHRRDLPMLMVSSLPNALSLQVSLSASRNGPSSFSPFEKKYGALFKFSAADRELGSCSVERQKCFFSWVVCICLAASRRRIAQHLHLKRRHHPRRTPP